MSLTVVENTGSVIISESGSRGPQGDQGIQGPTGNQGTSVLTGNSAPTALDGNDGDVYIRNTTGEMFKKVTGAWVFQSSLIGPEYSIGQIDGGTPSSIYGGTFAVFGGNP